MRRLNLQDRREKVDRGPFPTSLRYRSTFEWPEIDNEVQSNQELFIPILITNEELQDTTMMMAATAQDGVK